MILDTDEIIGWAESNKVITIGYLMVIITIIAAKHFIIIRMAHREGVKEGENNGRV